jgi:hypothetical protein
VGEASPAEAAEGVSSAGDLAAVRATFEAVAVEHLHQVRGLRVEIDAGAASASWIEPALSELQSLGKMAESAGLTDVATTVQAMSAILERAARSGAATLDGPVRDELAAGYGDLARALPAAFAGSGRAEWRQGIIVQSLLRQVPGMDDWALQRLFASGLNRLDVLRASRPDEMSAATGVALDLAQRVVQGFAAYAADHPSLLAALDRPAELRRLASVEGELRRLHQALERAAAGWSPRDLEDRKTVRRQREMVYQRVRLSLARLGEVDRLMRLERLRFEARLDELAAFLNEAGAAAHGGES